MTALKLIQKHETLEKVLDSMKDLKYQIPDPFPFDEARRLFKGGLVSCLLGIFTSATHAGKAVDLIEKAVPEISDITCRARCPEG